MDGDKDSTVKYFFHMDMQGSTTLVTDSEGKTVWTGDVTPFGEKVSGEGSFEGAVRFTGKEYDEDTGLYYFNARWYDPELGRFVEEDSYQGDINDPLTLNRYAYAGGNPLLYVDPTGHSFEEWMGWLNMLLVGSKIDTRRWIRT